MPLGRSAQVVLVLVLVNVLRLLGQKTHAPQAGQGHHVQPHALALHGGKALAARGKPTDAGQQGAAQHQQTPWACQVGQGHGVVGRKVACVFEEVGQLQPKAEQRIHQHVHGVQPQHGQSSQCWGEPQPASTGFGYAQ